MRSRYASALPLRGAQVRSIASMRLALYLGSQSKSASALAEPLTLELVQSGRPEWPISKMARGAQDSHLALDKQSLFRIAETEDSCPRLDQPPTRLGIR